MSPYQRRDFGPPIPIPVVQTDPLGSLRDLMHLEGGLEQLKEARAQRQDAERVRATERAIRETATEARGNLDRMAELLEQRNEWPTARKIRAEKHTIQLQQLDEIVKGLDGFKSPMGKAAQLLRDVEANPTLYPQLRPRVVELATAVHPSLAAEIPETYDPARVRGMLQFAMGATEVAETRSQAATLLKHSVAERTDRTKARTLQREAAGRWFSTVDSPEDWERMRQWTEGLVDPEVLAEVGPRWSTAAQAHAGEMALTPAERRERVPTTFAAALLEADRRGDKPQRQAILDLQKASAAAGRDEPTRATAAQVQAVLQTPSIWGDLTPSFRDRLLTPLAQAGFDFAAAARGLSVAQRKDIDQWREDKITGFNREVRRGEMTDAEHASEVARIERSYQQMLGLGTATRPASPLSVPSDFEGIIEQRGVRYHIKTDSQGKVVEQRVVP